ncbi:uncharacterized protein N0V89_004967 [Didymosphaeria variabile]|uniref:tRNA(Ile)-lysidine synthetase n=1 Tax=Didymosphaeria variabile TaxID=1932322 RepID=A0A9W9CAU3_9PLEO|nr:uncharacterized protein N0V89_004967 [Didymosphaeria variabile]KAJ4353240.1 hypothetical protein N0V89_004967 [Didymosphaeria variabile]
MALATMYAKCESFLLPKLHGFIIDHKARPGSTEEAHWVAEQLSSLGLQSTIIPLTWPEGFDFKHKSRFESVARVLRYQALGTACRDKGIKSLFLGHHADDQAETIMMRLATDRLRSGLLGMRPIEWMPECHGIHGVSHSGSPASERDSMSSLFEHGGIQVLRPLLAFEKSRLIATCETHDTRWAEDKTNQDRTLTARNAIRHIFSNHKLPVNLSKDSMLAIAQRTRSRVDTHKAAADKLFDSCLLKLDIQTASLVVRLPPVKALYKNPTHVPSSSEKLQARNTAHYLLRRVVELVSPQERPMQESIANAVLAIYPTLARGGLQEGVSQQRVINSNLCLWTKTTTAFDCSPEDGTVPQTNEWLISRQPPYREAVVSINFPPKQTSGWQLFDGRFWVCVHNLTDRPIIMRMLTDSELEKILQNAPNGNLNPFDREERMFGRRQMRSILYAIKPHALRRHLPALFLAPANAQQEPTLLALPTLQSSPDTRHADQSRWDCTWEVRYKKVDPGARTLSDIVHKPVYHSVEGSPSVQKQETTRAYFDSLPGMDTPRVPKRKKVKSWKV